MLFQTIQLGVVCERKEAVVELGRLKAEEKWGMPGIGASPGEARAEVGERLVLRVRREGWKELSDHLISLS